MCFWLNVKCAFDWMSNVVRLNVKGFFDYKLNVFLIKCEMYVWLDVKCACWSNVQWYVH
jgi:hypothetical protein